MTDKKSLPEDQLTEKVGGGKCFKCLRVVFCWYNLCLLLCGCVVLGLGSWTVWEKWYYIHLIDDAAYKSTSLLVLLTGLVAVVTGVLGYTAVLSHSRHLLAMYTILILIVFMFEAVLGLISYVLQDRLQEDLGDLVKTSYFDKYQDDRLVRASVDQVQIQFRCCGVDGYLDWANTSWREESGGLSVPHSCCKTPSVGCGVRDHPSNIHYTGCVHRLERDLYTSLDWVKVTSLGVSLVQVVGVMVTSCLLSSSSWSTGHTRGTPVMVRGYWRTH